MSIERLLQQRPDLWRGRGLPASAPAGVSTGFGALDRALPWGGWPPDGLSEILTAHPGAGLALLLPMLTALGRAGGGGRPRWLLLVDPPFVPYAPALAARGLDLVRLLIVRAGAEGPWAMEQALRAWACAVVVGWEREYGIRSTKYDGRMEQTTMLRRLQLAAAAGGTPAVLLRAPAAAGQASPAALRLTVQAAPGGLEVTLLKLRGGRAGTTLHLGEAPRVTAIDRAGAMMAR